MDIKKFKLYSCVALTFVSVLIPLRVLAYDESFYSSNDILFYNPDATGPTNSNSSTNSSNPEEVIDLTSFATSGPMIANNTQLQGSDALPTIANNTQLQGSDALTQILNYYIEQGLTPAQAAGIAGNFQQESGFRPWVKNSIGAVGIAQWLGPRKTDLFSYTGTNTPSLSQQLDFSWHELETTNAKALAELKKTNTPAEAAVSFNKYYERSGDSSKLIQKRVDNANAIYN